MFGFFYAALGETGLGKQIKEGLIIMKQMATLNKRIQHTNIYFFIRPFAFSKQSCLPILLCHNVDLRLASGTRICSPPTSQLRKINRAFSFQQQCPEILRTDILKNMSHII